MDRIRITGGQTLKGVIPISGAKNAALPLMIASLMTSEGLTLENVPRLADVRMLIRILENHGVDHAIDGKRPGDSLNAGQTIHFSAKNIVDTLAPYDLVSRMRASFWVLAPLIARMGEARVSLPGGCAIGTRPVDRARGGGSRRLPHSDGREDFGRRHVDHRSAGGDFTARRAPFCPA